jgi:S-adenosylmethionine synthetase
VTVKEDGEAKEEIRKKESVKLDFFTWEKLDYVDTVKKAFGL